MKRRAVRPVKPCPPAEMRKRIARILGFLPMPADELQASAVRCEDDVSTYATTLVDLLTSGDVRPDPTEAGWLMLADPDAA